MPRAGVLALVELLHHTKHLCEIAWDFPEFDSADDDILRLAFCLTSVRRFNITLRNRLWFSSTGSISFNDRNRFRQLLQLPTARDFDLMPMKQEPQSAKHPAEFLLDPDKSDVFVLCENNHVLKNATEEPITYSSRSCDRCREHIPDVQQGAKHCPRCQYDLCSSCVTKILGSGNQVHATSEHQQINGDIIEFESPTKVCIPCVCTAIVFHSHVHNCCTKLG